MRGTEEDWKWRKGLSKRARPFERLLIEVPKDFEGFLKVVGEKLKEIAQLPSVYEHYELREREQM